MSPISNIFFSELIVSSHTSWPKFVMSIEPTSKMVVSNNLIALIDVNIFNGYSFEQ